MASSTTIDEKVAKLTVTTVTQVTDKTSATATTTTVDALTPSPSLSLVPSPRPSDVSTPATAHNDLNPFDTDLEAMISTRTMVQDDSYGMKSTSRSDLKGCPEGQVWPDQKHWKKKAKAARVNQRSCQCLAKLSKQNRIIVKILIGVLVIAIAVGVGLGISKAVGAGLWNPNHH